MKETEQVPVDQIEPAETLHRILWLSNKLTAPFSAYLERVHGISLNEYQVLMFIARRGEAVSHEVASESGVNIMGISRAVAALGRDGRISICRDPDNRRRKVLRLTDEGRRLHASLSAQSSHVASGLLSGLRAQDMPLLDTYLEAMISALDVA